MATFKTNDNVELYYEVKGEGKPVLMIPGWTCTTQFFKKNSDVSSGFIRKFKFK